MIKLLRFLKPYRAVLVLIVVLAFAQAMANPRSGQLRQASRLAHSVIYSLRYHLPSPACRGSARKWQYTVRQPFSCCMVTYQPQAWARPASVTVPSRAATTHEPAGATRSTPRCSRRCPPNRRTPNGEEMRSKRRTSMGKRSHGARCGAGSAGAASINTAASTAMRMPH